MKEFAIYQNARWAFPDNIPNRGVGNTLEQKQAIYDETHLLNAKANSDPLNLPFGRIGGKGGSMENGCVL